MSSLNDNLRFCQLTLMLIGRQVRFCLPQVFLELNINGPILLVRLSPHCRSFEAFTLAA